MMNRLGSLLNMQNIECLANPPELESLAGEPRKMYFYEAPR